MTIKNLAAKFFMQNYWGDVGFPARSYVRSRGISDETAYKYNVGYAPNHNSLLREFKSSNMTLDEGIKEGLLRETGNGTVCDVFFDYVMFPAINDNIVQTFSSRKIPGMGDKNDRYKHLLCPGQHKVPINIDSIKNTDGPVYLVESGFNLLSMLEWGYETTIATIGYTSLLPWLDSLKGREVYIVYDNDLNGSGYRKAVRNARELIRIDVNPKIVFLPLGIDVNDYQQRYDADKFRKRVLTNYARFTDTKDYRDYLNEMEEKRLRAARPKKAMDGLEYAQSVPIDHVAEQLGGAKLERAGRGYKTRCVLPEHKEDVASMHLYTNTNSFYCFGCNRAGDTITLLRQLTGMGFKDAVNYLNKNF